MRFWVFVFVVAAMLAATQALAKPETIEFSDLVDPLAIVYDDPYRDMGFRLLNELKLLIELDEKLSQNNLAGDCKPVNESCECQNDIKRGLLIWITVVE